MRIEEKTIRAAYQSYAEQYGQRKNWNIADHVGLWKKARTAFHNNSQEDFHKIYTTLQKGWQVFRGAADHWSEKEAFDKIRRLDAASVQLKLSCLDAKDISSIKGVVSALAAIKTTKDEKGSLVAVSKFLHFWNPGLFIIVDRAVVGEYVFRHTWLKKELKQAAEEIDIKPLHADKEYERYSLEYYPAVLWLGHKILENNPTVMKCFREMVLRHAKDAENGLSLMDYEAPAIEWLLIGLVEVPPNGLLFEES